MVDWPSIPNDGGMTETVLLGKTTCDGKEKSAITPATLRAGTNENPGKNTLMRLMNDVLTVLAVGSCLGACSTSLHAETNLAANAPVENEIVRSPLRISPQQATCDIQVHYPSKARREGRQGRVFVHTVIDAMGQVASADVERSSGEPLFDEAALAAVKAMRCVPHAVDAKAIAVPVEMTLPVVFQLDPAPRGIFR